MDILVRIFCFQEKELGNDAVGNGIIDGAAEEDDAVFQEAGINIIAPFTLRRLFDDNRYIHICQN